MLMKVAGGKVTLVKIEELQDIVFKKTPKQNPKTNQTKTTKNLTERAEVIRIGWNVVKQCRIPLIRDEMLYSSSTRFYSK